MSAIAELIKSIHFAARMIIDARLTVALTGAGVSTPSGIPDFRTPTAGLWANVDPMEVASLQGFRANPHRFYNWIEPLARTLLNAQPNAAHLALSQLERVGKLAAVITQNIDMLHQRAGTAHVFEVHGHIAEATCINCFRVYAGHDALLDWLATGIIPRCTHCGDVLKPNVILFDEQVPAQVLTDAKQMVKQCDVMLVVGSSLEVLPAADLPRLAADRGAKLIIINREHTYLDDRAAVVLRADVADVLPALADRVTHDIDIA